MSLLSENLLCVMSEMTDSLGVPLIDRQAAKKVWENQKQHVRCIVDPPGVMLYTVTGSLVKGGVKLPTYRTARGSSSLESFHLHLNRFIPGILHFSTCVSLYVPVFNDVQYLLYMRWLAELAEKIEGSLNNINC